MKKLISLLLAAALLCTSAAAMESAEDVTWEPAAVSSVTMDNITASVPSSILMEKSTGQIICENNAHERLAPASVTKVMTILLIVEALESGSLSLEDTVTVSTHASSLGGSQIFLKENERMSVRDLLKAVVVASANDGAVALAEHISGSEEAFVAQMNERAAQLGMADTHFTNCTGLDPEGEHLTTAYDIALMSRELIMHDMIKEYTTIWMDTVRDGAFGLSNTNRLIRFYSGATGLKTGFTRESMYCLSATAQRDGVEYIAVIMRAQTSDIRFEAAKTLLNYAFATYTSVRTAPDEVLPPVAVALGKTAYVQPVPEGESALLLKKTQAAGLTKQVELCESVAAPVAAGQRLGTLTLTNGKGELLAELPLVAGDDVGRLGWWELFIKYMKILIEHEL